MANLYVYLLPAILHAVYACVPLTPPRPRPTPKPPGATGEVPATTTTTETTTTTVEACSGTPDNSTVTEDGNRCVFPFKDGDILHTGCVDYKGKYDWCATSLKSDCSFDTWSKCLETTSKPEEKCLTEEVNSGKECLFPFIFEGKEYMECLPYKGKFWCGLTYEYDKQRWGYCTQALCPPTKVEATEVPVTTQGPTEVPATSQEPETTTTTTTEVTTPLDWEDAQTTVDIEVDGSFYSCNIDFKMTTDQGVKYKDVTSSCSGSSKTDDMIDKLGVHRFTLTMQSGIGLSCQVGAASLDEPQSLTLSVEVMENTLKCEPLDSQCITIGGEVHPAKCVFPYNYQGRHYKACTDSSKDPSKLWCPTAVTASGEAEKDSWGFCATSCTYCAGSPITRGAPDCGFDCLLNPDIKMVGYEQAELLKPTMSMTIEIPEQDNVGGNYKFKIGSQTITISCPETKFHHPDLKGENTVIASCGPEKYRFTVKTKGGATLGTEIKKDFFGCDPCPQSTTYVKGYSLYLKVKSIGSFKNIASVSECHSRCLENSLCNSFEFSKIDKRCKLIEDVVKTGSSTETSKDDIICTKSGPTGEACSIANMQRGDCDDGDVCAVQSDCSTNLFCKQDSRSGAPTCQATSCKKACSNGQYCTYENKCLAAVSCTSNKDCQQPSECKQTVDGGAKTCTVHCKTSKNCAIGQFCDAANECQVSCSTVMQSSTVCGDGKTCDYKTNTCKDVTAAGKAGTCLNNLPTAVIGRPALLSSENVAIFMLAVTQVNGVPSDRSQRCEIPDNQYASNHIPIPEATGTKTALARAAVEILDAIYWMSGTTVKDCRSMMGKTISIAEMRDQSNPTGKKKLYVAGNLKWDDLSWLTFKLGEPGMKLAIKYILKKWDFPITEVFVLKANNKFMIMHAEMQLVSYAKANKKTITQLGVSKPSCCECDKGLTNGQYRLDANMEVFSGPGTQICGGSTDGAWCGHQYGATETEMGNLKFWVEPKLIKAKRDYDVIDINI